MKRTVFLAVLLLLSMAVFTGCRGSDTPTPPPQAQVTPAPAAPGAQAPEDVAPASAQITFPFENTVRFSMAATRLDANPMVQDVPIVQELMAYANVEIDWVDWPSSALSERMALAFATGDYPDALFGAWILGMGGVMNYSAQGFLVPLEEYFIPEIMPNWYRVVRDRPHWIQELVTPDGHIYATASLSEWAPRPFQDAHFINQTWLNRLNLNLPTTTDELVNVLRAFRDNADILNPNGVIPMSLFWGNHMRGFNSMMGWWGQSATQGGFSMRGDTVVMDATTQEYRDMIRFFSQLHSEGLIDQELFTHNNAMFLAKIQSDPPMVGVFPDWGFGYVGQTAEDTGYDIVMLPPLSAAPGVTPMWSARVHPFTGNMGFHLTDRSDPAIRPYIMAFIDLFYDPMISIRNNIGELGHNIRHVEGRYFELIHEASLPALERAAYGLTNRGIWMIFNDEFAWREQSTRDIWEQQNRDLLDPFVDPNPFPNMWMPLELVEERAVLLADINSFILMQAARWVSGEGDVDAEWDNYIAQLNAMGLQRLLQIQQNAYDASPFSAANPWRYR